MKGETSVALLWEIVQIARSRLPGQEYPLPKWTSNLAEPHSTLKSVRPMGTEQTAGSKQSDLQMTARCLPGAGAVMKQVELTSYIKNDDLSP